MSTLREVYVLSEGELMIEVKTMRVENEERLVTQQLEEKVVGLDSGLAGEPVCLATRCLN